MFFIFIPNLGYLFIVIIINTCSMDWSSLIKKVKTGEYDELELVYKTYRMEFIKWMMKSYKCSIDDAKDVYQQTIIIFYENVINDKIQSYNSSIKTYIFAIGKNKFYTLTRDKNRFNLEIDDTIKMVSDDRNIKEDNLNKLEGVEKSLTILGDPCKKILELYYYHKKSMNDIAMELGLKNPETAKNMKYKCLKRLRIICQKEGV
ncbi:hypothetical protein ES705_33936 [subsurface metagenome]